LSPGNFNYKRIAISGAAGGFGGVIKGPSALKVLMGNKSYRNMSSQVYNRAKRFSNNPNLKSDLIDTAFDAAKGLGISTTVKAGLDKLGLSEPFEPDPNCACE